MGIGTRAITYHNLQVDGDKLDSTSLKGDDSACALVVEAYQRAMTHKIQCGLQARLRAAYTYHTKDRIDKISFTSPEHDGKTDEECEDGSCQELFSVNVDFIRLQFDTAMSIYMDALKSRGNDYATVDPTPIPDTSEEAHDRIVESSYQSVLRSIYQSISGQAQSPEQANVLAIAAMEQMLGTQEGLDRLEEFITRQKTIENSKLFAEAKKKAKNAKRLIDDKLVESNYDDVIMQSAANAFWYDYSVIYAPYTKMMDTTVIKNGKLVEDEAHVWSMRNINPINHFFSETTTFSDMGDYEGDVMWMSRNEMKQIGGLDGGNERSVKEVLDNWEHYQQLVEANDVEEEYKHDLWSFQDRVPVIRLMIRMSDEQAASLFPGKTLKSGKASHIVELICAKDKLVYKRLYPRYKEYNPYRKNSFTAIEEGDIASGRGLYSICRTAQEMIDNSLVGLFENMQEMNKYILEVNETKLSDADELEEDLMAERPIIKTKGVGNYAQYGGNDRSLHIIQVPDNIDSFTNTLLRGIDLMERVGLSSFALGQGNFSNVRATGQSAILQANSNKRFGRFLQKQEQWIETPIIDYIWTTEAISGKHPGILVDSTISVKSYRGFLQKQDQVDQLGLFMQNLVGFMNARTQLQAQGQDIGFFDSLLKQYVDSSGFDSEGLEITQDVGGLTDAISTSGQDIVSQPLEGLDGRNNVPANINSVIQSS